MDEGPTFKELYYMTTDEERKIEVRPIICPCDQGKISSSCPKIVFAYLHQYLHKNLCKDFDPDNYYSIDYS